MALLGDEQFRRAVDPLHVALPLLISFENLGIVAIHRPFGFTRGNIIVFAINEHDNIGILLDRAGFAKIGQLGALVLALLDGPG